MPNEIENCIIFGDCPLNVIFQDNSLGKRFFQNITMNLEKSVFFSVLSKNYFCWLAFEDDRVYLGKISRWISGSWRKCALEES